MAEESRSAEKDLLKIIENPQSAAAQPAKAQGADADAKGRGGKAGKSRKGPKVPPVDLKTLLFNRHSVIKILFSVSLIVLLYLIYSIISEAKKLKVARNFGTFIAGEQTAPDAKKTGLAASVDFSALTDGPLRNIFRPKKVVVDVPKADQATDALKNYKLVGLSLEPDQKDSQAMVENTTSSVTFFVKRGEVLDGMEIVDILEDRLILKVNGQRTELR